jgi:uncharacterized protein with HEPN domain
MSGKDDRLYLVYIRECIARIEEYTVDGKQAFLTDTKTQDAVLRNLQVLAESTQKMSQETKAQHPEIDWRNIGAFRNVLVHHYLGIDLEQTWDVVQNDIPDLKAKLEVLFSELGEAR